MAIPREDFTDLYETVHEALQSVSDIEGENPKAYWMKYKSSEYDKAYQSDGARDYEQPVFVSGYYLKKSVVDMMQMRVGVLEDNEILFIVAAKEMEKVPGWSEKDLIQIEGIRYTMKPFDEVTYGNPLLYLFKLCRSQLREQVETVINKSNPEQVLHAPVPEPEKETAKEYDTKRENEDLNSAFN